MLTTYAVPRIIQLSPVSSWTGESRGCTNMNGSELKQLRIDLGEAIGRSLSTADMAKLCGLSAGEGSATILKWEVSGPSGPAAELLRILAMASERHPILESFNIFYRFDIEDKERPMRMEEFRKMIQKEVLRRLG